MCILIAYMGSCVWNLSHRAVRLILFLFQADSKCTQCCCGAVVVINTQASGDK